jgi:hypothetical protein
MAVVKGTNAGFVTVTPSADPEGVLDGAADQRGHAVKDVSPATAGKIVEVGWWCNRATEEANWEMGLYDHNAGADEPDNRLYVADTNAKGTDEGWKSVAVDWDISGSTTYWIAMQLDNTATATTIDRLEDGSERRSILAGATTLPDPWTGTGSAWYWAIYAKWEVGADYTELSGTIAAASVVENADLGIATAVGLSGTIASISNVENASLGQVAVSVPTFRSIKRLITIGNSRVYYETIT